MTRHSRIRSRTLQLVQYLARVEWAEFRHRPIQAGMRLVPLIAFAAFMGLGLAEKRSVDLGFGPVGFAPMFFTANLCLGTLAKRRITNLMEQELLAPYRARGLAIATVLYGFTWALLAGAVFVLSFYLSTLTIGRPGWAGLDPVSSVAWFFLDLLLVLSFLQAAVAQHFCWRMSGWRRLLASAPGLVLYLVAVGAFVLMHVEQVAGTPLASTAQVLFYACIPLAILVNFALWAVLRHQAVPERIIIAPLKLPSFVMQQVLRD